MDSQKIRGRRPNLDRSDPILILISSILMFGTSLIQGLEDLDLKIYSGTQLGPKIYT